MSLPNDLALSKGAVYFRLIKDWGVLFVIYGTAWRLVFLNIEMLWGFA